MENQQKLKDRLIVLLKKDPRSVDQLARDIGIDKTSFHHFWNMHKKIRTKNTMRIEGYLDRYEENIHKDLII